MSKTSTAVKQRYLDKAYDQISVRLPKDLVRELKDKCKRSGVPIAKVIRDAAEDFIKKE